MANANATPKKNFLDRVKAWFRGLRSELKKVVWPSKKQIINNSGVVMAIVASTGVVLWVLDWLSSSFVQVLINLFA